MRDPKIREAARRDKVWDIRVERTSHLGRNPRRGGMPPRERRRRRIDSFLEKGICVRF